MTMAAAVLVLLAGRLLARRAVAPIRHRRAAAKSRAQTDSDETRIAELVALGLSAGLTFPVALEQAAELETGCSPETVRVLRAMRTGGIAAALESHDGDLRRLAVVAGRAQLTGAPLLPAVEALIDEHRSAARSERLSAVRRLPVQMAIPLALLILPGFVVLVTAPALIASLDRLGLSNASP